MKKEQEPKNVVYVKEFENGGIYVGVSSQFEVRMKRHELDARNGKLDYPVYRAMRKYKHETKIIFRSDDYEEVLQKEIDTIKEYREKGVEVYNLTDGGQGHLGHKMNKEARRKLSKSRTGYVMPESTKEKLRKINLGSKRTPEVRKKMSKALKGKNKGAKNGMSKPIEHFLSRPFRRDSFKRTCKVYGWDFFEFKEILSHKDSRNKKYFLYSKDPEGAELRRKQDKENKLLHSNSPKNIAKPLSYWASKGTYITSFKDVCKRWGWDFNAFEARHFESKVVNGKTIKYYSFHLKEGKTPFGTPQS